MSVEPEDAAGPVRPPEPRERAEGDGMVAAEDERDRAVQGGIGDGSPEPRAGFLDLRQETSMFVTRRRGLGDRRRHVPEVDTPMSDRLQPSIEPRIPDRRGAHVDAAPPGAEVEGSADHGNGMTRRLHRRGRQG